MTGTETTVYEIPAPGKRDTAAVPSATFTDGELIYRVRAPKMGVAISLMSVFGADGKMRSANEIGVAEGLGLAQAIWQLISYIDEEPPEPAEIANPDRREDDDDGIPELITNPRAGLLRGRARIMQRLQDADDVLDIDSLAPVFGRVLGAMFPGAGRPTGPSRESSPALRNGGHASEAASSDKPDATSST